MMQMNTDTYYRLLNCGLKLAAGAGSATGAKETPVGYNRAYIRSAPGDGIDEVLGHWKAGRNFVTNGPMLFFSSGEGLEPGDSLLFDGKLEKTFRVKAISDSPLDLIEIVVNGNVVRSFQAGGVTNYSEEVTLVLDESSWVCARCTDRDILLDDEELEAYRGPRITLYQDPNRLRFAHTSPIYFIKGGVGIAVEASIREGLAMLEKFREFAGEKAAPEFRDEILEATDRARILLEDRLN
jgi:hypothetical protein